jgi:hypothetical protein
MTSIAELCGRNSPLLEYLTCSIAMRVFVAAPSMVGT